MEQSKLVYISTPKGGVDLRTLQERQVIAPPVMAYPYGKQKKAAKIAHGLVEYRKSLVVKASRVGMTLEQYCQRFNIKL